MPISQSLQVPWDAYVTAHLITEKDASIIRRYDKQSPNQRALMLDEVCVHARLGHECACVHRAGCLSRHLAKEMQRVANGEAASRVETEEAPGKESAYMGVGRMLEHQAKLEHQAGQAGGEC